MSSSRVDQLAAVDVADALLLGRVELDVEDVAVLDAGAAPTEAAHDLLVADVDQQHRGQLPTQLAQLGGQRLGLRRGAREAVEDEAVGRLAGVDPLADHADDHLVGDEVAAVHVVLGGLAELGSLAHRGAEDVPGRVVRQLEVLLQALALRALARPRGAEQDQIQLRRQALQPI